METRKKILILTDFTQTCYDSVSYGLDLCRYYHLEAEVFHVGDRNNADSFQVSKTLEMVALYNQKFSMNVSVVIRQGNLSEEIALEVKQKDFYFVILGTHGKSGFQALTGSLAAKIITALKFPILVVQSRKFSPIESVALPFFSEVEIDNNFSDILPIVEIFGAKFHFFCRQNALEKASCFVSKYLQNKETSDYEIIVLKDTLVNFSAQMISYCSQNNVSMIFSYPQKSKNLQSDVFFVEQLMFNIPQIPVMCKYI